MTEKKRGGFRKNAKRPLKYGEKTVVARFTVPKSKYEALKAEVKAKLKNWETKKDE